MHAALAALNPFSPLEITHVPLDHGGYDRRGRYWGVGPRLYEVSLPDGEHFHLRAAGILDAKKRLSDPNKLYREGFIRARHRDALLALQTNENPLSRGRAVGLGLAAAAALGGLLYAVNASAKPKAKGGGAAPPGGTGAKLLGPADATWKPLGAGDAATPNHTYLMSMSPVPGYTLQEVVTQIPTAGFTVLGAWGPGTVPAGWPSSDAAADRWRIELNVDPGGKTLDFAQGQAEFPQLAMFELQGAMVPAPGGGGGGTPSAPPADPSAGAITLKAIPGDNGYINLTLGAALGDPQPGGLYVRSPPGTTIVQMSANPDGVVAVAPQKDGALLLTAAAAGATIFTFGWNSPGGQPTTGTLEVDVGPAQGPA